MDSTAVVEQPPLGFAIGRSRIIFKLLRKPTAYGGYPAVNTQDMYSTFTMQIN